MFRRVRHRFGLSVAGLAFASLALGGCAGEGFAVVPVPEADLAVEALLPAGSYEFSGTAVTTSFDGVEVVTELNGFVDFGPVPGGSGCSFTLTMRDRNPLVETAAADPEATVSMLRGASGSVWVRVDSEEFGAEWRDMGDLANGLGAITPVGFTPFYVTLGDFGLEPVGVAGGLVCSLAEVGHFMRVESRSGDEVTFGLDLERALSVNDAATTRWVSEFVDAGIAGGFRSVLVAESVKVKFEERSLLSSLLPVSDSELKSRFYGRGSTLTPFAAPDSTLVLSPVSPRGVQFSVVQPPTESVPVEVTLVFEPVPSRTVNPPQQLTYFDRVALGLPEL